MNYKFEEIIDPYFSDFHNIFLRTFDCGRNCFDQTQKWPGVTRGDWGVTTICDVDVHKELNNLLLTLRKHIPTPKLRFARSIFCLPMTFDLYTQCSNSCM